MVYLVQTEGELPKNLECIKSKDADIICLSWKKRVKGNIYLPRSRWTEGRNRLLQEVINKNYLYYIFLDDDVVLKKTKYAESSKGNPWRYFEKLLLKYKPAVGVPDYDWKWGKAKKKIELMNKFDAIATAFHKDSLKVLLPYYGGHEKFSWWHSNHYILYLCSIFYPKNILRFNALKITNEKNRPYPRKMNKVNTLEFFNNSILDKKRHIAPSFEDYSPVVGNVKIKDKKKSYLVDEGGLSRLFDLNHPFWKEKNKLLTEMSKKSISSKTPSDKYSYGSKKINTFNLEFIPSNLKSFFWEISKIKTTSNLWYWVSKLSLKIKDRSKTYCRFIAFLKKIKILKS